MRREGSPAFSRRERLMGLYFEARPGVFNKAPIVMPTCRPAVLAARREASPLSWREAGRKWPSPKITDIGRRGASSQPASRALVSKMSSSRQKRRRLEIARRAAPSLNHRINCHRRYRRAVVGLKEKPSAKIFRRAPAARPRRGWRRDGAATRGEMRDVACRNCHRGIRRAILFSGIGCGHHRASYGYIVCRRCYAARAAASK